MPGTEIGLVSPVLGPLWDSHQSGGLHVEDLESRKEGRSLIRSGLVSITFRQQTTERVISLACEASLSGIEWGGDVHVPHGEPDTARRVGLMTRDAGLQVAAYGSYYFVGQSEDDGLEFSRVLETAKALEAPTIRVWAGTKGSDKADDADWSRVVDDAQRIAGLAAQIGTRVCLEYHGNSLTDHHRAATSLHKRIACDNVDLLWQPLYNHGFEDQLSAINSMLPLISNIHVFWWLPSDNPCGYDRLPLADGIDAWTAFVAVLRRSSRDRFAMLEFVKDDDVERFFADAHVLHTLLNDKLPVDLESVL